MSIKPPIGRFNERVAKIVHIDNDHVAKGKGKIDRSDLVDVYYANGEKQRVPVDQFVGSADWDFLGSPAERLKFLVGKVEMDYKERKIGRMDVAPQRKSAVTWRSGLPVASSLNDYVKKMNRAYKEENE